MRTVTEGMAGPLAATGRARRRSPAGGANGYGRRREINDAVGGGDKVRVERREEGVAGDGIEGVRGEIDAIGRVRKPAGAWGERHRVMPGGPGERWGSCRRDGEGGLNGVGVHRLAEF